MGEGWGVPQLPWKCAPQALADTTQGRCVTLSEEYDLSEPRLPLRSMGLIADYVTAQTSKGRCEGEMTSSM